MFLPLNVEKSRLVIIVLYGTGAPRSGYVTCTGVLQKGLYEKPMEFSSWVLTSDASENSRNKRIMLSLISVFCSIAWADSCVAAEEKGLTNRTKEMAHECASGYNHKSTDTGNYELQINYHNFELWV